MNEPIISISEIERRAGEAAVNCEPMSACPYPNDSTAAKVWRVEYRRLTYRCPTSAASSFVLAA